MEEEKKLYTISILTENRSGLLNKVTIIFTRRKVNIESINVSETEIEGVSRYHIVIEETYDRAENAVKQIRKVVDVLGAFLYREDEIYHQEIALYKVPTSAFMGTNKIEDLVRNNGARILSIEEDFIIIEKSGHRQETMALYGALKAFGVLEFTRSGQIAVSKSKRKTEQFLEELELASLNGLIDDNN